MIGKKIMLAIVLLTFVRTCTVQEEYPPSAEDALWITYEEEIVYIDNESGDITFRYTLIIENIYGETLERVILTDFQLLMDMTMNLGSYEMENLGPDERGFFTFEMTVEGWGLNPTEQLRKIWFTVIIEEGDYYTEKNDFFEVYLHPSFLYPTEESSGSQILLVFLVGIAFIVIAVLTIKRKEQSGKTKKSSEIAYTEIVLEAMKGIRSEILLYGLVIAALLLGLACISLEVVRELKWAFVIMLIVCLAFYFLTKREENKQKKDAKEE